MTPFKQDIRKKRLGDDKVLRYTQVPDEEEFGYARPTDTVVAKDEEGNLAMFRTDEWNKLEKA